MCTSEITKFSDTEDEELFDVSDLVSSGKDKISDKKLKTLDEVTFSEVSMYRKSRKLICGIFEMFLRKFRDINIFIKDQEPQRRYYNGKTRKLS